MSKIKKPKIEIMKYLRKFDTLANYVGARGGIIRPSVSLIDEDNSVKYDPLFQFNPRYLYSDMTTSLDYVSGKTVIGIEVIPGSHMEDGKARFVSVKNMSRTDPENGCTDTGNSNDNPAAKIPWGNGNVDVPELINYDSAGLKLKIKTDYETEANPFGIVNELDPDAMDYAVSYLVTDFDIGYQGNNYPFFDGAYLTGYLSSGHQAINYRVIPYPFNQNGTRNSLYWEAQNGRAISDMNGKENTEKLISHIGISGWQSGVLNTAVSGTTSESFNHPAAAACYRFNAGVEDLTHQWYLPAVGELGYLFANIAKINSKIDALPSEQGVKLGVLYADSMSTNTLGSLLWSSSERDSDSAWDLYLKDGGLSGGNGNKAVANSGYRVRAFLAVQQ